MQNPSPIGSKSQTVFGPRSVQVLNYWLQWPPAETMEDFQTWYQIRCWIQMITFSMLAWIKKTTKTWQGIVLHPFSFWKQRPVTDFPTDLKKVEAFGANLCQELWKSWFGMGNNLCCRRKNKSFEAKTFFSSSPLSKVRCPDKIQARSLAMVVQQDLLCTFFKWCMTS